MPTSLTFEFGFTAPRPDAPITPPQAMRILLLGDFGGGAGATIPLAQRRPRRVDLDNVEQVLAQLAPSARVTLDGVPQLLRFSAFDDFHPEHLFAHADAFADLRARRAALLRPGAAPAAAQPAAQPTSQPTTGGADDFAGLLGGAVGQRPASGPGSAVDQLVRQLLAAQPAAAPTPAPDAMAAFDAALGERMRAVLHDPAFQAVEALWRGVRELVTGLDLEETLQLWLLDAGKEALRLDAAQGAPALRKLLIDDPLRGADPAPWTLLCGAHAFGANVDDIVLLDSLALLAAHAGAPFIGNAHDSLAGTASLAAAPDADGWQALDLEAGAVWQALRTAPHAPWVGLALPRVLLRLPYGRATDPVDGFAFEEALAGADPVHEDYLWGHASIACALLLGRAYAASGWDMTADDELELDDLPAHTVRRDGVPALQACAEAFLAERAGSALLARGLMPLLSYKNRAAVRLLRSQSLAAPARALAGAWNR